MNILDTIIAAKNIEITERKELVPSLHLEKMPFFKRDTLSFRDFLLDDLKTGIIAEFKRQSPSKGIINDTSSVQEVTAEYAKHGASAISVLTDEAFFGGRLNDLVEARTQNIPLLRKDFMIDEYQLIEAKAFGADIILLIAACLSPLEVKSLSTFAKKLGLSVLLEIHTEEELEHIHDSVDVIGINNRNLKNFEVDIQHSIDLGNKIPGDKLKIAESGIHDVATIKLLQQNGFNGFLMGEKFMKEKNPGEAFRNFVNELKS
ncbi:MAG: indole-3-glycerol phosphate synthase TrpC [Ginsengibacter sp.]